MPACTYPDVPQGVQKAKHTQMLAISIQQSESSGNGKGPVGLIVSSTEVLLGGSWVVIKKLISRTVCGMIDSQHTLGRCKLLLPPSRLGRFLQTTIDVGVLKKK